MMRLSEGEPKGRFIELYNPEIFQEHDEVIVFTRDEFNRTYTHLMEQIDYINKTSMHLDHSEEWKLLGYWPKIIERIHLLDLNMDLIFEKEPLQCYLDSYLCNTVQSSKKEVATSKKKAQK